MMGLQRGGAVGAVGGRAGRGSVMAAVDVVPGQFESDKVAKTMKFGFSSFS